MATVTVTNDTLAETIEGNDIVLLDFWADWCGPCKQFAPVFDAASAENEDVVFGKVDTEAEQQLAAAAGITSIPTLMAFREKVMVFNQAGALDKGSLDQLIAAVKGLDMTEVHAAVAQQQAQADAQPQQGGAQQSGGAGQQGGDTAHRTGTTEDPANLGPLA
ncbi:hypothetical protein GCM10011512_11830 [Tersicoccus solisilvae]|uniref:Thioredoxin n=1 Tax=Tersicoccus solisilvae TaxID=1882339 RepID=A0ABQ1NX23_9MICC|nr:thioredoxin [Tersicoccus solisilvae]GGC86587.1 hypothetical protein GCM10011512_11830 [Tersicoccus solisilvae]